MATTDISQTEVMNKIKNDLEGHVGGKMRLKANMGRCKIIEKEGVLEEVHPNLFIIKVEEEKNRYRRISYSYVDVLTRSVELTHIRSKKNIFPWLFTK
ncbi:MAG: Veg family protein [Actinobacteria bacterium]|nr:Veg family protein [Actinomycetota bacterium]